MESLPPLNTTVFIYALTEPTGEIRYVGKSSVPARRFSSHLRDNGNNHRTCWIKSLRAKGLSPLWKVLDEVPVGYWKQWEAAYIQFFQEEGCDLVNGTSGGEGAERGNKNCLGRIQSLKTREKRSGSLKGRMRSQETRDKISKSHIGKKHSLATLGKFAGNKNALGSIRSLESIKKMVATRRANGTY